MHRMPDQVCTQCPIRSNVTGSPVIVPNTFKVPVIVNGVTMRCEMGAGVGSQEPDLQSPRATKVLQVTTNTGERYQELLSEVVSRRLRICRRIPPSRILVAFAYPPEEK
jgi:hypothetical protein